MSSHDETSGQTHIGSALFIPEPNESDSTINTCLSDLYDRDSDDPENNLDAESMKTLGDDLRSRM